MAGPLPNPQRRRRNPPTIPTTNLPAGGRRGRPPKVPSSYSLKAAGAAWWKWAWTLPQAMAWDVGALYVLARRAQLEDDLAVLDHFDHLELAELLEMEENDALRQLGFVIGRLKGMAGGRTAVMREMRELDKALGLTPEALAKLRWKIVADEEEAAATPTSSAGKSKKKPAARGRGRLRAVDPVAAAS